MCAQARHALSMDQGVRGDARRGVASMSIGPWKCQPVLNNQVRALAAGEGSSGFGGAPRQPSNQGAEENGSWRVREVHAPCLRALQST